MCSVQFLELLDFRHRCSREKEDTEQIYMDSTTNDESASADLLLCQESGLDEEVVVDEATFIDITKSSRSSSHGDYSSREDDDEEQYVEMLIDRELSSGFKRDQSSVFDDWLKCARLEAIAWILKTRAVFGFRFQTAYLSMTYFDRFLSRRSIDSENSWAVKLLSVACLSLAAKMEEVNVPLLSEFQIEEYNFERKVIQRMELLVLNTLEWKMITVTPFSFLHYLIPKFSKDSPPPRHTVSRTVRLILSLMREINLMDHRPSVIAAAATLMALDQSLTRMALECKMNSISYSGFLLEIEDVFQCYSLTQKLEMEDGKAQRLISSPDVSPGQLRPMDVSEHSLATSGISTKRKRLAFNNPDENQGLPDEKRLR